MTEVHFCNFFKWGKMDTTKMMKISGRQTEQRVCKINADKDSANRWEYTDDCKDVPAMPNLNFADQAMASDREYFGMFFFLFPYKMAHIERIYSHIDSILNKNI